MVSHGFRIALFFAAALALPGQCLWAQTPAVPAGTAADTTSDSTSAQFRKWRNAQTPITLEAPDLESWQTAQKLAQKEPIANTTDIPQQILKTGINLNSQGLSANTLQLADTIHLTPILESINGLRIKLESATPGTLEHLQIRQDLYEAKQNAHFLLQRTDLEIDFAIAEINAESEVYSEVLATFVSDRDRAITRTNAAGFISNGVLWAACEAFAIPTYRNARYAIPSGILGIPAGVVPSIASMWTLKQIGGKKDTSEVEPNMLAKLFDYPTNGEIEYPRSVWLFLNQVPPGDGNGKTRKDQIIDRWITDQNIPDFQDRKSVKTLDILTGSVSHRKGLSIGTLTARKVMLDQLAAEIMKMKRFLLELSMTLQGTKHLHARNNDLEEQPPAPKIGSSLNEP